MIPEPFVDFSVSDIALGGVISVAVSVLAILFAVKCKYSTAKWRGAGARCFWFSLLFILPTIVFELIGEALLEEISWGGTPFSDALLKLLYFIVFVGGSEEAGKILAVYTGTGGYHRMNSQNDILNYALISAAAFTGLENILYFFQLGGDITNAILRAALSSPFHITCTMLIALGVLRSMQEGKRGAKLTGIVAAILIHGCYDFVADYVMQSDLSALAVLFVIFMIVAMIFVVLNILKAPRRYAEANSTSTCRTCGNKLPGFAERCSICGASAFVRSVEFPPMTFPKKPEPTQPLYYMPVQQMPYAQNPYVQQMPPVQAPTTVQMPNVQAPANVQAPSAPNPQPFTTQQPPQMPAQYLNNDFTQ